MEEGEGNGSYILGSETEQTAVLHYDYNKFTRDLEDQFPSDGVFALNSAKISKLQELNPTKFVARKSENQTFHTHHNDSCATTEISAISICKLPENAFLILPTNYLGDENHVHFSQYLRSNSSNTNDIFRVAIGKLHELFLNKPNNCRKLSSDAEGILIEQIELC